METGGIMTEKGMTASSNVVGNWCDLYPGK